MQGRVNATRRRPEFQNDFNLTTDQTGVFNSTLSRDVALPVNATVDELDNIPISEVQSFKEPALPWYSDQALPFEITVAMANEYGSAASAKLFGVEILNEGWGMSIDDSVNEQQATFVAPLGGRRENRKNFIPHFRLEYPVSGVCRAPLGILRNRCRIYPAGGAQAAPPLPFTAAHCLVQTPPPPPSARDFRRAHDPHATEVRNDGRKAGL